MLTSAVLSEHELPGQVDRDPVRKRTERLIGFFQLLTNVNALRAMLFALAAFDALCGKCRCFCKRDRLNVL